MRETPSKRGETSKLHGTSGRGCRRFAFAAARLGGSGFGFGRLLHLHFGVYDGGHAFHVHGRHHPQRLLAKIKKLSVGQTVALDATPVPHALSGGIRNRVHVVHQFGVKRTQSKLLLARVHGVLHVAFHVGQVAKPNVAGKFKLLVAQKPHGQSRAVFGVFQLGVAVETVHRRLPP